MRLSLMSISQFGAQEWLMKRAVFAGVLPSIIVFVLVQKRYLPVFAFICAFVAGRPMYSMMHAPFGIRSVAKSPRPLCERLTFNRKPPGTNRFLTRTGYHPCIGFRRPADAMLPT